MEVVDSISIENEGANDIIDYDIKEVEDDEVEIFEETICCYICGQPIDDEDWSSDNVKQTSFGLMHFLCPNKLIISNVPNTMNDDALYKLFIQFGPILEASINGNMALIEFEKKESAKRAVAKMNGYKIESNTISIKYAHDSRAVNNTKPQNENQPITNRYIHSKESLRSMSAMQIVSLLVTEKKKYREVNKKWMRLVIGHQQNEDVIDFIHECKANDATKDFVDGCVPMPSYLASYLYLDDEKKYEKSAKYVQNEARPLWLPSQHIILVCGFIRKKIEKRLKYSHHWIIPTVIIDICFRFYCSITSICVLSSSSFVKFNFNDVECIISKEEHPGIDFVSCVHIPHIEPSFFPNLYLQPSKSNEDSTFSALFGCNRDRTQMDFIVRRGCKSYERNSSTGLRQIQLEKTSEFVFCGFEYGICVLGKDWLYQLKLKDLSTYNFTFHRLCPHPKYAYGAFSLCYLKGRHKLLAVEMNHVPDIDGGMYINEDYILKCAMYDFETNAWNEIESLKCEKVRKAFYAYDTGTAMVYNDHNRSFVYALNVEGSLCKYDLNERKWSTVIKFFDGRWGDRWTKRKPILWFDCFQHHILYCAIWQTPQQIAFYWVNLNASDKKWQLCVDWNQMIKNMSWDNKAMLFK